MKRTIPFAETFNSESGSGDGLTDVGDLMDGVVLPDPASKKKKVHDICYYFLG